MAKFAKNMKNEIVHETFQNESYDFLFFLNREQNSASNGLIEVENGHLMKNRYFSSYVGLKTFYSCVI